MVLTAAVAVPVIAITIYSSTRDRSREYATLKAVRTGPNGKSGIAALACGAMCVPRGRTIPL